MPLGYFLFYLYLKYQVAFRQLHFPKTTDSLNLERQNINIDNNGKEYKNARIFSSKLLKAKEQVKSQDKDKKSILGQIKSFKTDDKTKSTKKDHSKGAER